ncbi:class I SAM-dependent methyltransferase [Virgibacillus kekensis]|uniref:Class I SAM-dependent methyltransferase n=1 Tax=Virgibacillus kekensis TaxID=202261 RepID=A0ABV9DGC8_9BACI
MPNGDRVKETVRQQFSENAREYLTSVSHAKGTDLQLLLDWLKPHKDWIVLDIATGGGHVAKTVAPYVNRIYATDITEIMLENTAMDLAPQFGNMDFIIADAESLPFLKEQFDLVLCRIAPHHFPNPDKFVQEVARVLKEQGKFILIDNVAPEDNELAEYVNTFEKLRDESHVRCLSILEWKELFKQSGLIEVKAVNRKKKHEYETWVERMARDKEQIQAVTDYILNGNKKLHEYFNVIETNGSIQSVEIDEWMVLCEKGPNAEYERN